MSCQSACLVRGKVGPGKRLEGSGEWNGSINNMTAFTWGPTYKSCNQQADLLTECLNAAPGLRSWSFSTQGVDCILGICRHYVTVGIQNGVPTIIMDPWVNEIAVQ